MALVTGTVFGVTYMIFACRVMDTSALAPTRFMLAGMGWLALNFAIAFNLGGKWLYYFPLRVVIHEGLAIFIAYFVLIRERPLPSPVAPPILPP